ncbi:MAG TPA: ABC transporter permease subunit/CPBP intramembrane protease [Pirellulaceae bacterium]|nr:ABC transporter permease subunit/CPBP intramembrane protease [Pirellulaceae bacterium]HMO91538.1 ABC transporter permease subunit/CPBP intramembrane protease [Pirellulaceae bacterium]HMP68235.1 ABC transporter permease subunit/CPBP intramembrane protease [Pirellulaceae bacterium]
MNWKNTKFIFQREIIDQMRDRRTLFTILVLPLILYPLLGSALLHTAQFMHRSQSIVWIIGANKLPKTVPLVENGRFVSSLADFATIENIKVVSDSQEEIFANELRKSLARLEPVPSRHEQHARAISNSSEKQWLQSHMQANQVDVIVWVADEIGPSQTDDPQSIDQIASVQLIVNSARDKSRMTALEVQKLLGNWRAKLIEDNFVQNDLPFALAFPFAIDPIDVVDSTIQQAATWSKILPLIVMLWALTGAFYPAIDLCAGEKERGTLETLLSSPATRAEIVIGKMMTIMVFSVGNSILNLFSMMLTGFFVIQHLGSASPMNGLSMVGAPPLNAIPWIVLGLLPVAAMFSALALALASFARSSKEGQYYLIPLLMCLLPLMMLSSMPTTNLELGTSFIPVTGMMLLLRSMIEGNYSNVVQYASPVLATTLFCCWLSIRWAVAQFNSENVLFRSSDQFGFGLWLKQVMRDRDLKPSLGQAILCVVTILIIKFFLSLAVTMPQSWHEFAKQIWVVQIAAIAIPGLLMAAILTRCAKATLRLNTPRAGLIAAAALTAILLYPALSYLGQIVLHLYPPRAELQKVETVLAALIDNAPGILAVLLVFSVVPAICEELTFRGFILSGLEKLRGRWSGVILTSIFFGATHAVFQQSVMAFVVGLILGFIALRTASIWPCIAFHMTHNGMTIILSRMKHLAASDSPFTWVLRETELASGTRIEFEPLAACGMTLAATVLLIWIGKQKELSNPTPIEQVELQPHFSTPIQST